MNIGNIKDCYGCGVCATVCAKKIIDIKRNSEGFYEPRIIDSAKCTNCGLCIDVCSYSQDGIASPAQNIKSYATWSKAEQIRYKASSGGAGFEIAQHLIKNGCKVCTVKYNAEKQRAEHYIATTIEELIPSLGSKYIQSYTVDGFKAINRKEKYLVVGTPCQIDSFRRYIQKFRVEDNFILMDFFCHGVPSYEVWKAYIKSVEKKIGKITDVVWRHKKTGWHDSWAMSINEVPDENNKESDIVYGVKLEKTIGTYFSKRSDNDAFYALFLGNNCLGKACYSHCKYKYTYSSADIRIGDMWGNKYKDNKEGVTALITFNSKGEDTLKAIETIEMIEYPIKVVAEGQMLHKMQNRRIIRKLLITMLRSNAPVKFVAFTSKVFNKVKRTFKI